MSEVQHQWLGYARGLPAGQFVAMCSCGWRSEPVSAAGLAGAAADAHCAEQDQAAAPSRVLKKSL